MNQEVLEQWQDRADFILLQTHPKQGNKGNNGRQNDAQQFDAVDSKLLNEPGTTSAFPLLGYMHTISVDLYKAFRLKKPEYFGLILRTPILIQDIITDCISIIKKAQRRVINGIMIIFRAKK